jgi:hypothetical protein
MEAYGYQSRDPDLAGYSAEVKKSGRFGASMN